MNRVDVTQVDCPQPLVLLGLPFHNVTFDETVAWVVDRVEKGKPACIATVNVDFIMQAWGSTRRHARGDPELQRILLEADLVVADGNPIVNVSRLFGPRLKERVTGSDLTPMLAEAMRDAGKRVFGLGAAPGVAARAMEVLRERYPGLQVAGAYSPPKADVVSMDHDTILAKLEESKPDLLLVAFGAPKQEKFINMHVRQWKVPAAIGIGGTLDFLAGAQTRAPRWVQRLGAEWLWRMSSNPKRLFMRYARNLVFLAAAVSRLAVLRLLPARKATPAIPAAAPEWGILPSLDAVRCPFDGAEDGAGQRVFVDAARPRAESQSLVVDLGGVPWLNSVQLGSLVTLTKICRQHHHGCFIVNASPRVKKLLGACHLTRYLACVGDARELVDALRAQQSASRTGVITTVDETADLVYRMPRELTAADADAIRDALMPAITSAGGSNIRSVVGDAGGLDFVDSTGVRVLLEAKCVSEEAGLTFRCFGFHGKALHVLDTMRLTDALTANASCQM